MRVIATAVGHDGTVVRNPGEEFDMPEGSKGSWFKPATLKAKQQDEKKKPANQGDDFEV